MSVTESTGDERATADVTELSPSAKLVYKVLEYEGELTQSALAEETRLCARTVRYALSKLENNELIDRRVHVRDARQSVYRISR